MQTITTSSITEGGSVRFLELNNSASSAIAHSGVQPCSVFIAALDTPNAPFSIEVENVDTDSIVYRDPHGSLSVRASPAGHLWVVCAQIPDLRPGRYIFTARRQDGERAAALVRYAITVEDNLWAL